MKNADTSVAMGSDKARHVRETGAEVLVAGDNSCLMHIGGLLSRQRSGVRVMHLAEVLAATESRPGVGMTGTFVGMPAVPRGGPRRARRHAAAAQPGARHDDDPRQARRASSPRSTDWEELRARRRRRSRTTSLRDLDHLPRSSSRRR